VGNRAGVFPTSQPTGNRLTTLELWDSNGTLAGGQFVVNGVAQTRGHEIDVSPANVAGVVFDVAPLGVPTCFMRVFLRVTAR
jgi:hypothetical protein